MSFGPYPEVSLAEARARRDQAKAELRSGSDPMAPRRRQSAICWPWRGGSMMSQKKDNPQALAQLKALAQKLEGNPQARAAVKAALKAMKPPANG